MLIKKLETVLEDESTKKSDTLDKELRAYYELRNGLRITIDYRKKDRKSPTPFLSDRRGLEKGHYERLTLDLSGNELEILKFIEGLRKEHAGIIDLISIHEISDSRDLKLTYVKGLLKYEETSTDGSIKKITHLF